MNPAASIDCTCQSPESSCLSTFYHLLSRYHDNHAFQGSLAIASSKERKGVTHDMKSRLIALYGQGTPIPGISKELGLEVSSVTYHLKTLGLREPRRVK